MADLAHLSGVGTSEVLLKVGNAWSRASATGGLKTVAQGKRIIFYR